MNAATTMESNTDFVFVSVKKPGKHTEVANKYLVRSHVAKYVRRRAGMRATKKKGNDIAVGDMLDMCQNQGYVIRTLERRRRRK